ncbi:hemerythrin domain-containing protein [Nocardia sp. IFM 10818]
MSEPDLLVFTVIHRAMRTDVHRLAALGAGPFAGEHEAAVRRYLYAVLTEIQHHHATECAVLWPVIAHHAGAVIDLAPFTDDHAALEPILARARTATGSARARALRELAEQLDEHVQEKEALLFPVLREYVPTPAFDKAEKRFHIRPAHAQTRFAVPWLLAHAHPAERRPLLHRIGAPARLVNRTSAPAYRTLAATVFD